MLIYVNIHRENKKTQKLFNLCGIIFSFFPSTVICFFLFDLIRSLCGASDGRLDVYKRQVLHRAVVLLRQSSAEMGGEALKALLHTGQI